MVQMYYKRPPRASRIVIAARALRPTAASICMPCPPPTPELSLLLIISRQAAAFLFALSLVLLPACNRTSNTIAVIPRACGTPLWEPEHAGAAHVARRKGMKVYWNAPTREDDVAGQIALLEKVVDRGYAGIIITPDQTLALAHSGPTHCLPRASRCRCRD